MDIQKVVVNSETKYFVNGKEYNDLDEMPDDLRAQVVAFSEMDSEKSPFAAGGNYEGGVIRQRFEVNGEVYDSLEEMPPEFREFFRDEDGNGLPDVFDAAMGSANSALRPKTFTKVETTTHENINEPFRDDTGGLTAAEVWERNNKASQAVGNPNSGNLKLIVGLVIGTLSGAAAVFYIINS